MNMQEIISIIIVAGAGAIQLAAVITALLPDVTEADLKAGNYSILNSNF